MLVNSCAGIVKLCWDRQAALGSSSCAGIVKLRWDRQAVPASLMRQWLGRRGVASWPELCHSRSLWHSSSLHGRIQPTTTTYSLWHYDAVLMKYRARSGCWMTSCDSCRIDQTTCQWPRVVLWSGASKTFLRLAQLPTPRKKLIILFCERRIIVTCSLE